MPFPGHTREEKPWLLGRAETQEVARSYCNNLFISIQENLHTTPEVSARKHNGFSYLTVKIRVKDLKDEGYAASHAPTDRFPSLKKLEIAAVRDGLTLSQESCTIPFVILEYKVGVSPPDYFEQATNPWLF